MEKNDDSLHGIQGIDENGGLEAPENTVNEETGNLKIQGLDAQGSGGSYTPMALQPSVIVHAFEGVSINIIEPTEGFVRKIVKKRISN